MTDIGLGPEESTLKPGKQRWLLAGWRGFLLIAGIGLGYVQAWGAMALGRMRSCEERAHWLSGHTGWWLRLIGVRVKVLGRPPRVGLLVSNHIGYLDIFVLASVVPTVFVAKKEVGAWPFFGIGAKIAGTLLVDRDHPMTVAEFGAAMMDVMGENVLLTMFPEGTSSDGTTVLPFKTSLFEPLVALRYPATACALNYAAGGGDANASVGFYGDAALVPHLARLLQTPQIEAAVHFGEPSVREGGRKEMARSLFAEVSRLKCG
jgi:1-acyl-sn-glycerol-3-phosphate acyltransferase